MKEYLTGQRKVLFAFFEKNKDGWFAIDQILSELPETISISRSAVYRNIDRMEQEGYLRKSLSDDTRKALYQYNDCSADCPHIHLRCEQCGRIFHLQNEEEEKKLKSVLQENEFQLDEQATMLIGKCKKCSQKEQTS